MVSLPDSNAFREAFKRLDLMVVHDLFMTETAELANYVFPPVQHLEKTESPIVTMYVMECPI